MICLQNIEPSRRTLLQGKQWWRAFNPQLLCIFLQILLTPLFIQSIDIVQAVSESRDPAVRPRIPDSDTDVRYIKLMQACWDENPLQRPTFEAVKAKIRQMHGGR